MKARILTAAVMATMVWGGGWALAQTQPATAPTTAPATAQASKVELKDQKDKVSYIIGIQVGMNIKKMGVEVDTDKMAAGIKDAMSGAKPALSEEQVRETMMAAQKEMMAKAQQEMKAMAEKNQKEETAFLAANAKKEGVKTTASGLQYKVIKEGTGKAPKPTDTVMVNYKGTLPSGEVFDSSEGRGPATFAVNRVIPGWTEALLLMKEGGKMNVVVPSKLAYGPEGAGEDIGPNQVLIFEVELLSVTETPTTLPGMPTTLPGK